MRLRLDPGRRPTVALGAVVCVVMALSLWWVLSDHPQTEALPPPAGASAATGASSGSLPPGSSSGSLPSGSLSGSLPSKAGRTGGRTPDPGASDTGPSPASSSITVDVTGKVLHPGLYELPADARVQAALTAAGGPVPGVDLSKINLARRLVDGEQIAVAVPGAPEQDGGGAPGPGTSGGTSALVNLNSATTEQLDSLPGVGPALAKRILDWRAAHQRFDSVDRLREVPGIGPAKFGQLKALVTV